MPDPGPCGLVVPLGFSHGRRLGFYPPQVGFACYCQKKDNTPKSLHMDTRNCWGTMIRFNVGARRLSIF
jgi:hypothetical protein